MEHRLIATTCQSLRRQCRRCSESGAAIEHRKVTLLSQCGGGQRQGPGSVAPDIRIILKQPAKRTGSDQGGIALESVLVGGIVRDQAHNVAIYIAGCRAGELAVVIGAGVLILPAELQFIAGAGEADGRLGRIACPLPAVHPVLHGSGLRVGRQAEGHLRAGLYRFEGERCGQGVESTRHTDADGIHTSGGHRLASHRFLVKESAVISGEGNVSGDGPHGHVDGAGRCGAVDGVGVGAGGKGEGDDAGSDVGGAVTDRKLTDGQRIVQESVVRQGGGSGERTLKKGQVQRSGERRQRAVLRGKRCVVHRTVRRGHGRGVNVADGPGRLGFREGDGEYGRLAPVTDVGGGERLAHGLYRGVCRVGIDDGHLLARGEGLHTGGRQGFAGGSAAQADRGCEGDGTVIRGLTRNLLRSASRHQGAQEYKGDGAILFHIYHS